MVLFIFANNRPTVQQGGYFVVKCTDYYLVTQIYSMGNAVVGRTTRPTNGVFCRFCWIDLFLFSRTVENTSNSESNNILQNNRCVVYIYNLKKNIYYYTTGSYILKSIALLDCWTVGRYL